MRHLPSVAFKMVRLDRLARSTRDLLNVPATISGFRSLGDPWADTATPRDTAVPHPLPLRPPGQKTAAGMHVFKIEQGVCNIAQKPVDNPSKVFNFEQCVFLESGELATIKG
jgi:hypothetical protein